MALCDGLELDFLHIRLKTRLGRHCYSNPAPIVEATKSIWSPGYFAAVKPHILWQQCPEKSDPERRNLTLRLVVSQLRPIAIKGFLHIHGAHPRDLDCQAGRWQHFTPKHNIDPQGLQDRASHKMSLGCIVRV